LKRLSFTRVAGIVSMAASAALLAGMLIASPASAGTTGVSPQWYTGQVNQDRVAGSETTYYVTNALFDLYNQSSLYGCTLAADKKTCMLTSDNSSTDTRDNYDRNEFTNGEGIGSTAGIAQLCGGASPFPVDAARSSRQVKTTECGVGESFAVDSVLPLIYPNVSIAGLASTTTNTCTTGTCQAAQIGPASEGWRPGDPFGGPYTGTSTVNAIDNLVSFGTGPYGATPTAVTGSLANLIYCVTTGPRNDPGRFDGGATGGSGSTTIADSSALAADHGEAIAGAGIPLATTITVATAGVGYTISNPTTAAVSGVAVGTSSIHNLVAFGVSAAGAPSGSTTIYDSNAKGGDLNSVIYAGSPTTPSVSGIPAGTTITAVVPGLSFTISAATTATVNGVVVAPTAPGQASAGQGINDWGQLTDPTADPNKHVDAGASFAAASTTITDAGATANDMNKPITGAGIAAGTRVVSSNPGVSLTISHPTTLAEGADTVTVGSTLGAAGLGAPIGVPIYLPQVNTGSGTESVWSSFAGCATTNVKSYAATDDLAQENDGPQMFDLAKADNPTDNIAQANQLAGTLYYVSEGVTLWQPYTLGNGALKLHTTGLINSTGLETAVPPTLASNRDLVLAVRPLTLRASMAGFVNWLCYRDSAAIAAPTVATPQHGIDLTTGNNYGFEVYNTLTNTFKFPYKACTGTDITGQASGAQTEPLGGVLHTDAGATFASGSNTVSDAAAVAGDLGQVISGPNVGENFITSVNPGVGYTLFRNTTGASTTGVVVGAGPAISGT